MTNRTVIYTYNGRRWRTCPGLEPSRRPTPQELRDAGEVAACRFLLLYAVPEDAKHGGDIADGIAALFPPPLSDRDREVRNWVFGCEPRVIDPILSPEDEATAYDGGSKEPQRRDLTPNERDLLCRLIRHVSGDARFDSYGIDMIRLLVIANVIDPRTE